MYVEDMTLSEAWEWEKRILKKIDWTRPGSPARAQAEDALGEIYRRIDELEA